MIFVMQDSRKLLASPDIVLKMDNTHQRIGSKSNAHVGKEFELASQKFFNGEALYLELNIKIPIGVGAITKLHAFDLGSTS